ncbi:protein spaetzle 4 isoform X2 [Ostrinia nubilalis]|uniref:protein spaetzle 4 isoform X3 n=1 Tax=Ostrinia furnacalis TaxID=93504 RepID=UPI00103F8ADB|nr:protein spaetzle 4 isoform X3 [Ostrinia furnacalis]
MLAIAIVIVACALPASAYDFASACTRPYRSTRAHAAPDAPCDLTKHAYCATPGSSYPWQAIRRFVRENQGLMRRMYGEERHISVLKAELDNFIEDDDLDSPPDFAEDIIKTKMMYSKRGRAMKDKPHFRPIQSSDKKKVENDSLRVKPLDASDASTLPPTLLFSEHEKVKVVDRVDTKVNDKKEEPPTKPTHQQEKIRPSVIKLRGANACETKEELLAPFWANNTRGEKLVLVNMYPYEQYIHLETCVHERKQMYCREGCRCEQHYRLHRLLAFDPHNPCRGIFSDWFKFPACCVCRCYDVPLEFRARSPRLLPPQYGEDVKRIIYEDVARDWYSMTAYGDDEDYDLL